MTIEAIQNLKTELLELLSNKLIDIKETDLIDIKETDLSELLSSKLIDIKETVLTSFQIMVSIKVSKKEVSAAINEVFIRILKENVYESLLVWTNHVVDLISQDQSMIVYLKDISKYYRETILGTIEKFLKGNTEVEDADNLITWISSVKVKIEGFEEMKTNCEQIENDIKVNEQKLKETHMLFNNNIELLYNKIQNSPKDVSLNQIYSELSVSDPEIDEIDDIDLHTSLHCYIKESTLYNFKKHIHILNERTIKKNTFGYEYFDSNKRIIDLAQSDIINIHDNIIDHLFESDTSYIINNCNENEPSIHSSLSTI